MKVTRRTAAISRLPVISQPEQGAVIARLTVTRANGWRTIVEVRAGATFHEFYRFYRQFGARRSTKEIIRTASRNEGLFLIGNRSVKPGLELIRQRLESYGAPSNPVVKVQLRIIKKRLYRKLLSMVPDELGMLKLKTQVRIPMAPIWMPVRVQRVAA